jgi:hypothetical protein
MKKSLLTLSFLLAATAWAGPFDHCGTNDAKCVGEVLLRAIQGSQPGGCGGGMVSHLGSCYAYGAMGDSCTQVCSKKGLHASVDSLSSADCLSVATKIGLTFTSAASGSVGCNVENGTLYYATGASPDVSGTNCRRICECS